MEPFWELNLEDIKGSFSSAHFVLGSSSCEPLHGHDYTVKIAVRGVLNANQIVIDFLELKPLLRNITKKLDGKFLLPTKNPDLIVSENTDQVILTIPKVAKKYVFPIQDVVFLPIQNSTVEEIAAYICSELKQLVEGINTGLRISVWVGETPFQGVWYHS